MFWTHLDPPRVTQYVRRRRHALDTKGSIQSELQVHLVCDMDKPHCYDGIKTIHDLMNMANGGTLGPMPAPVRKPPNVEPFPMAGSCACCKKDSTAIETLSRCSKCKMTRCACVARAL